MKKQALVLSVLLCSVSSAFAQSASENPTEVASIEERKLVCDAVAKILEVEQADFGIDSEGCKLAPAVSTLFTEGTRVVSGLVPFQYTSDFTQMMECTLAYTGTATIENIVDGLESVDCVLADTE